MHASASQLALVLLLIGWKGGANLLSQSHRVESAKPITFRHSNENRSSTLVLNTLTSKWSVFVWFCLFKLAGQCPQINELFKWFLQDVVLETEFDGEKTEHTMLQVLCSYQHCPQFYMSDYSRPLITVYLQVARKSSRLKLCRPKFYHAQQHPNRVCFVCSKL